jgi:hypothetical protein
MVHHGLCCDFLFHCLVFLCMKKRKHFPFPFLFCLIKGNSLSLCLYTEHRVNREEPKRNWRRLWRNSISYYSTSAYRKQKAQRKIISRHFSIEYTRDKRVQVFARQNFY